MRTRAIFTVIVIFAGLGITFNSSFRTTNAQDDSRTPPDVVKLATEASLGQVTFNHKAHYSGNFSADGTTALKCVDCHHVEKSASEAAKDPLHKTVYPADRTATLTADSLKDPATPPVTQCRSCHLRKGEEPKLLAEIPSIEDEKTGKTLSLTNQNAFHRRCAGCHDKVAAARPEVKAPKTMKCLDCHKKS